MTYKVRKIVVHATPRGAVWFDRRWKWYRPGMGTRTFRRKTKIGDVLGYIANYYAVPVQEVGVENE